MSFTRIIGIRFVSVHKHAFSKPVVRVAVIAIALSTAVMLISVGIVRGFQQEIYEKLYGFSGHIRLMPYQFSHQQQQIPIVFNDSLAAEIQALREVRCMQPSAEKAGIIKTDEQMEGCMLKGIGKFRHVDFFQKYISEGSFPCVDADTLCNEVLISKATAQRLLLQVGDPLFMFFLIEGEVRPRARKFVISGIYETGLAEFDSKYIFGDLRHVQRLNNWNEHQVGVVEIFLKDPSDIEKVMHKLIEIVDIHIDVWDVRMLYPEIFNWLKLLDMNVIVIIIIMLFVTLMNVVTIMLIRILEKTQAIGILKSLGATSWEIRNIFIFVAVILLVRGMLIGNFVALFIMLVQHFGGIIKLDQEMYYVSEVPIYFDWVMFALMNGLLFLAGLISMLIPSLIVTKITPAQTLRMN